VELRCGADARRSAPRWTNKKRIGCQVQIFPKFHVIRIGGDETKSEQREKVADRRQSSTGHPLLRGHVIEFQIHKPHSPVDNICWAPCKVRRSQPSVSILRTSICRTSCDSQNESRVVHFTRTSRRVTRFLLGYCASGTRPFSVDDEYSKKGTIPHISAKAML
jgi:hypothetical protein